MYTYLILMYLVYTRILRLYTKVYLKYHIYTHFYNINIINEIIPVKHF